MSPARRPLFLAFHGAILFIRITLVWRRWKGVPGVTFIVFGIAYACGRFALEFYRSPAAGGVHSGLSPLQLWILVAAVLLALVSLRNQQWKEVARNAGLRS